MENIVQVNGATPINNSVLGKQFTELNCYNYGKKQKIK